ncbi:hypothetical protein AJ79_09143 [Helicocarpus griseus UAMH5409]|uniref:Uncharacterized protein n=1 Tax=Helicocarpus griseus UAMH5409 TaxID=1447875 RepID=A0A2B7WDW9_9EURO|nr:hypothetical protein AJ79_09143 [Helicocarpus griseus UAMH5409]
MPSLPVTLRFGQNSAVLFRLQEMQDSSGSAGAAVPGKRLGESWTPEEDRRLLELHAQGHDLKGPEFQKLFEDRSYYAVIKRLSVLRQQETSSPRRASLTNGVSRTGRRTSTPQYVYSDLESEEMSIDSSSDGDFKPDGHEPKKNDSTKKSKIPNSSSNDTLKRKSSTSNSTSRPSPPKHAKTPTSPAFTPVNSSSALPKPEEPNPANPNPNPLADSRDSSNYSNHLPTPNFTSSFRLYQTTESDIVYFLQQAKKCEAETKRAETLAIQKADLTRLLSRSRYETQELLQMQKNHDNELEKTKEALYMERQAKEALSRELHDIKQRKSCQNCEDTNLVRPEQLQRLNGQFLSIKTAFDKVKIGSSALINPEFWRSQGMEETATLAEKTFDEMESELKQFQRRASSQLPP